MNDNNVNVESKEQKDVNDNNKNIESEGKKDDTIENEDGTDNYTDVESDDEFINCTQKGYNKSEKVAAQRKSERKTKKKK